MHNLIEMLTKASMQDAPELTHIRIMAALSADAILSGLRCYNSANGLA
jgi:hypothetical protein